ncbi:hypothetical protein GCM10009617_37360 [Leifsonia poae]|uniref:Uncharacterized protein n=1 Tax=Leifsonia poae TaxID=110933 RepID=A0A9W6H9Y7_9MICO|nr:hypothetical protein GCM10017584_22140 [Leifsonia poae]
MDVVAVHDDQCVARVAHLSFFFIVAGRVRRTDGGPALASGPPSVSVDQAIGLSFSATTGLGYGAKYGSCSLGQPVTFAELQSP